MTNILKLPKLQIPCTIETNETWIDSVAFVDVDNNPVAIDDIVFVLAVRTSPDSKSVFFSASSSNFIFALKAGALVDVHSGGSAYAINDTIVLHGGLQLTVANEQGGVVQSVSIKAVGSFSDLPTNPVPQLSTSGVGTGATFDLTLVYNALAIIVPPTALTGLPSGEYVYEIRAQADGYDRDVLLGSLTVDQGVVR